MEYEKEDDLVEEDITEYEQVEILADERIDLQRIRFKPIEILPEIISELESPRKWTVEETKKLIRLYKSQTVLWNYKHPDFKSREHKYDVLKIIAKQMNSTINEIRRKIKNINTQYVREKKKCDFMRVSGFPNYRSRWFGYDDMLFLNDKSQFKGGYPPIKEETLGASFSDDNHDSSNDIVIEEGTVDMKCQTQTEHDYCDLEKNIINRVITKSNISKDLPIQINMDPQKINTSIKKDLTPQGQAQTRDQFDVFGELVAHKIRNLENRYAKTTVQHLINNLLYNAELGKYNTMPVPQNPQMSNLVTIKRLNIANSSKSGSEDNIKKNNVKHKM